MTTLFYINHLPSKVLDKDHNKVVELETERVVHRVWTVRNHFKILYRRKVSGHTISIKPMVCTTKFLRAKQKFVNEHRE